MIERYEFIRDRRWDLLLVIGAFLIVAAAMHLEHMLFAGDWDFWTDWKDRLWWPVITPVVNIIIPSALQYITWSQLRLPVGATLGVFALLVATWVSRLTNWWGWAYFPINFVWPSTMVLSGVAMDLVLMYTRSYAVTSLLGALVWGLLFQPQNWPLIIPFLQPAEFGGYVLTVADIQGFQYLRTATPEYVRIVEKGNLRAFLQQITYVAAFFSSMASIFTYWIGQFIGRYLAIMPITKFYART